MIRDYDRAVSDLKRVVALTKKMAGNQVGTNEASTNLSKDLRQASLRLSEIEEAGKNDVPLNMYLIL